MSFSRHVIAVCLGLAVSCTRAHGISIQSGDMLADYRSLASVYQTVGGIFYSGDVVCTGTVIGPYSILTAAHCLDWVDPASLSFTLSAFPAAGELKSNVADVTVHPMAGYSDANDIAILTTRDRLPVAPATMVFTTPPSGSIGTFVGYGFQMTGAGGYIGAGTRLAAQSRLESRLRNWLEADFDSPAGTTSTFGTEYPLRLEGSTGLGDSGGPLFVDLGYGPVLVGVLWGGYNPYGQDSTYGDISQWLLLNESNNISFLREYSVPEPNSTIPCALVMLAVLGRLRRSRASSGHDAVAHKRHTGDTQTCTGRNRGCL